MPSRDGTRRAKPVGFPRDEKSPYTEYEQDPCLVQPAENPHLAPRIVLNALLDRGPIRGVEATFDATGARATAPYYGRRGQQRGVIVR